MSRIMGVDYGLRQIGIAMTDVLQIVASPYKTIESLSLKKDALKIMNIAKNNDISTIVLGLPINMNGTESKITGLIRKLMEEIKSISDIDVTTVDERLTTVQSERMLIDEFNISRKKRKVLKDKIAAALILQIYLDIKVSK